MQKQELISDIILRMTKGKPSDDLELEPKQIAYWANLVLPFLVQRNLEAKLNSGDLIDPAYILQENCKTITPTNLVCDDDCKGFRYQLTLLYRPVYLKNDRGIVDVVTSADKIVHKMMLSQLFMIKHLPFSKPSFDNPVYHRVNKTLYIDGLEIDSDQDVELNVSYIPNQDLNLLSDTDNVYVGDDLLDELSDRVEEKARRQMYGSFEDRQNDGKQMLENGGRQA